MDNLLNDKTSGDLNQFENELNELKSITENYHHLLETLKSSEAKYRFLTENSADIVWHLDKNLRFTYVSPADKKIRGYEQEEVIGLSIWDILTPDGKIILEKIFAEKERNNIPKNQPTRYELPLICKNGSSMWCEVNVNPITDEGGEVIGYNGITRDITERKRFEEEIKSKNEKLKELNDNKDKFFSIIAHDLRSPFQGLLGVSNLLITEADNLSKEEIKEFAMLLNNSLNNQFRLLEDLLSWARIQSGKMKFEPITLNALEETYNVLQMFKTNLKSKNIDTKINVGEDVTVFADKDMFYLLLRNLISNAIKFTNPGGLIEINASIEGENVVFEVKDNGIGIEEEDVDKLFKLNSHYSTEGTHNEVGTGLGLVLCKEITDRHKGKIWVESAAGSGSSFMFTLPKYNS
jgi:PAS domain S-box-containing protein